MGKYIGIITTGILLAVISAFLIVGSYKEKVDDNETAVETHAEKIDVLEDFSTRQTMAMERIQERDIEQIQLIEEQTQLIEQVQEQIDEKRLPTRSNNESAVPLP